MGVITEKDGQVRALRQVCRTLNFLSTGIDGDDEDRRTQPEFLKLPADELLFLHKTATAKALEAQDEGRLRNLEADHEREMAKLADEEEKAVRAVRGA